MRPQHFTGENAAADKLVADTIAASMRPQHFTGENGTPTITEEGVRVRFNEAPAFHWGKLGLAGVVTHLNTASMRPQHFTGENDDRRKCGFADSSGFNEAPAFHWGKHHDFAASRSGAVASMRPQHFTGENTMSSTPCFACQPASMRPQHFTGENFALHGRRRFELYGFNEAPAFHWGKRYDPEPLSYVRLPLQ